MDTRTYRVDFSTNKVVCKIGTVHGRVECKF